MAELLYNDTVKFSFNEGQHVYSVAKLIDAKAKLWSTETPVVGVTTVCGIMDKPALKFWAAGLAANYMAEHGLGMTKAKLARLAEEAKRQHTQAGDKGKAAGSVGHALVEDLLLGRALVLPSEPEAKLAAQSVVKAFKAWSKDYNPDLIASELGVYSLAHNFAGKFDLLADLDGKITLIDFKTSNTSRYAPEGIYPEMFCQLGGYLQLINEQLGVEVDEAMIVNLPKKGGAYKLKSLSDLGLSQAEAKMYFLNALGLYNLNSTFSWRMRG